MSKIIENIENIFYKQREDFYRKYKNRNKRFTFPEDITMTKGIPYATDGIKAHRLDIMEPSGTAPAEGWPVIINIHGGGLLLGSKEFNQYFCARLCTLGYLVFNVEYRLIPDCTIYDQISDIFQAMDFIQKKLDRYRGNSADVYAVGDSGGACLLVYATAAQRNPKVAKAAGVTPSALPLKALGLISGMFYTNKFDQIGLFMPKYLYGPKYRRSAFAPYVNPEHPDIMKSLPPCFLVTSGKDHLRRYTMQFKMALDRAQMESQIMDFPDDPRLTHAFSAFEPELPESTQVFHAMTDYFKKL